MEGVNEAKSLLHSGGSFPPVRERSEHPFGEHILYSKRRFVYVFVYVYHDEGVVRMS